MVTGKELKEIADKLKNDESFCRLAYYGENPFDDNKQDVIGLDNYKEIMDDIIRYAPQLPDVENMEQSRICLFKHYTKLNSGMEAIRYESVQIDLYVPHRLMNEELRVYELENKIVNLIDGMNVGVGTLDYVDGRFVVITNVSGYVQFSMIFTTEVIRRIKHNARF